MKSLTALAVSNIGVPLPLCFSRPSERQSVTLGSNFAASEQARVRILSGK
jgi:hypothetical protein